MSESSRVVPEDEASKSAEKVQGVRNYRLLEVATTVQAIGMTASSTAVTTATTTAQAIGTAESSTAVTTAMTTNTVQHDQTFMPAREAQAVLYAALLNSASMSAFGTSTVSNPAVHADVAVEEAAPAGTAPWLRSPIAMGITWGPGASSTAKPVNELVAFLK